MIRNVIGSVLAVIGAAGAVASPFQSWYDGRHGRDYRVEDLFNGITGTSSDLWVSLLLPFAFAALVTLLGLVLRSRLLVALSGLIVLGFTILWMVRQGQRSDGLTLNSDGTGIGLGVAAALGGGALLLIAAAVMSGRRSRGGRGSHRYVAGDRAPERYGGYGEYGDTGQVGQVGQVGYDEPEPYRTHQYPPYDAGHPPAGSTEQHAWDDTREQQPWTPPPQQQPPQPPPPEDRP
ncbi:hypothetical protein ACFRKD_32695 [Streptomyces niveus]|uniref:hypothetical protein n=1 Tax=Streptomyces niveus TaxID=193462 RepID=UPI00368C84FE